MEAKKKRRGLRFSLRTMLIVFLVFAATLGAIFHSAHRQKLAVAYVEKTGGWVKYDYQLPGGRGAPWGPDWFLDLFGPDCFNHVRQACLSAELDMVRGLAGLHSVELIGHLVEDRHLAHLAKLPKLREVHIRNGRITQAGLEQLPKIRNLEVLDLAGTRLSGFSLAAFNDLPNLRNLSLSHTNVDESELKHLHGAQQLERLALCGCDIHDSALAFIPSLIKLQELELRHTEVTNDVIIHLQDHASLRRADLRDSNVDRSGIEELEAKQPSIAVTRDTDIISRLIRNAPKNRSTFTTTASRNVPK